MAKMSTDELLAGQFKEMTLLELSGSSSSSRRPST